MFIVFDLDGTLSDPSHRLHLIKGKHRNWNDFFIRSSEDAPKTKIIELMTTLRNGGHNIEIWSGRSDIARTITQNWLYDNIGFIPILRMRKDGDHTPDHILKESWLKECGIKPDIIFDDRQRVVDMWRKNGITCCQVDAWKEDNEMDMIKPYKSNLPMLTIAVGPSGSGKTTYIRESIAPISKYVAYVSSDDLRIALCGDMQDQSRNREVFQAAHRITRTMIESGIPVFFDATNIRTKDRKAVVELCPPEYTVEYLVIDRPLEEKLNTADWRREVFIGGKNLVVYHDEIFKSNLRDIMSGDGYDNVIVTDLRIK